MEDRPSEDEEAVEERPDARSAPDDAEVPEADAIEQERDVPGDDDDERR